MLLHPAKSHRRLSDSLGVWGGLSAGDLRSWAEETPSETDSFFRECAFSHSFPPCAKVREKRNQFSHSLGNECENFDFREKRVWIFAIFWKRVWIFCTHFRKRLKIHSHKNDSLSEGVSSAQLLVYCSDFSLEIMLYPIVSLLDKRKGLRWE